MDALKFFNHRIPECQESWGTKDAILYALGLGLGMEVGKTRQVRPFLYEQDLLVVPTFANVLGPPLFWTGDAEFGIQWKKLLHVEQRLVIHRELPAEGTVTVRSRVTGIRDKGESRGALVFQEKHIEEAGSGEALSSIQMSLLFRADGGCGDFGDAPDELPGLPERRPDLGAELHTSPALPFIYRLSGDFNPLHVDPVIAVEAGFERPVMHGLCNMGLVCLSLLQNFCSWRPVALRELSLRFSHPVYPGDQMQLECWDEGGGLIRFRARVKGSRALAIDRGMARIH